MLKWFRNRVVFPLWAAWVMLAASCGGSDQAETVSSTRKAAGPNVLLVVSDALRQDVIRCYGGKARTPNIDLVARAGVLFENAYSTSPWTPPSSVSIFTGNYATSYPYSEFEKTIQIHVPDEEVLLAEVLRDRGYVTVIKNGNAQAGLHNCFQGFNVLPVDPSGLISWDAHTAIEKITGAQVRETWGYPNSYHILSHLLALSENEKFFMAQWILDPHEPFVPLPQFSDVIKVDPSRLTKPVDDYTRAKHIDGTPNAAETAYLRARYIAEVESVDERLGYLLKMLAHQRVINDTYIIFTADHGELFGEHDLFGHGVNYYEELVKVPLLIAGPGLPKGKRIDAPVSLVDLMATLKDLLDVEYEDNMQGESFAHLLRGGSGSDSVTGRPLYFDDVREHVRVDGLLDGGFKLVVLDDASCELFDLSNDPSESNNLAASREDRIQAMLPQVMSARASNRERQAANLLKLEGGTDALSVEEKEALEKQLRTLGYIQ